MYFRLHNRGLFGDEVEWTGEDYLALEDEGQTIVVRQCAINHRTGESQTQYLVGTRREPRSSSTSKLGHQPAGHAAGG